VAVAPDELLELMKGYFQGKQSRDVMETFSQQMPTDLLKGSLDVVDFVVYLEDKLEVEIDLNALGETLVKQDFGALSREVSRMLADQPA
jgi:acyl carrier protein